MSILKAYNLSLADGTVRKTPVNAVEYSIPFTYVVPPTTGYVGALSSFKITNTISVYSFVYTPVLSNSKIIASFHLDVDSSVSSGATHNILFYDSIPLCNSMYYVRNQNHEPHHFSASGVLINNGNKSITFNLRASLQASGTLSYRSAQYSTTGQALSNTISIIEVQQ